jgi:hypothetical protein
MYNNNHHTEDNEGKHSGHNMFNFTSRTLTYNEQCVTFYSSAICRKPFTAPSLNMVSKNVILTAIHLDKMRRPQLTANWKSSRSHKQYRLDRIMTLYT